MCIKYYESNRGSTELILGRSQRRLPESPGSLVCFMKELSQVKREESVPGKETIGEVEQRDRYCWSQKLREQLKGK